jgi:hypothetical protein
MQGNSPRPIAFIAFFRGQHVSEEFMSTWMCTVDWPKAIGVIRDLIVASAAIFTASVAYLGISKWKSEEQGKADFDLSRRALQAIFRFQSEFQRARSAFTGPSEFPEGYDPNDHAPATQARAWSHVFQTRINKAYAALTDLDALRPEMDALWGEGSHIDLDRFYSCYSTLMSSMQLYVRNESDSGRIFQRNDALRRRTEADVFDTGQLVDGAAGNEIVPSELTERLKGAVADASAKLRTYLPMHNSNNARNIKVVANDSQQK